MKTKRFFTDGAMLLTCLLMLAAIAFVKNKRLAGHDFAATTTVAKADSTQAVSTENGVTTVNTTSVGKNIIGYGGPVPLKISLTDGRITRIEVLSNAETPEFIAEVEQEVLSQYIGKTTDEAAALQVDAVSGATLSSNAVIKTMRRGLQEVKNEESSLLSPLSPLPFELSSLPSPLSSFIVALLAALVPLFYRRKTYRTVQLVLNVVVLGFYTGTFVSYSSAVSILSNGIGWEQAALGVLLVVAFLYPLFRWKGHYCAWCCPLGSAQELMGKTRRRKLTIPPTWLHGLKRFRQGLWCVLMLLAWTGILTDWMDYELFSAFLWQSASWVLLVFGIVVLVLSIFIPRPYCRFICPTGTLLKWL